MIDKLQQIANNISYCAGTIRHSNSDYAKTDEGKKIMKELNENADMALKQKRELEKFLKILK